MPYAKRKRKVYKRKPRRKVYKKKKAVIRRNPSIIKNGKLPHSMLSTLSFADTFKLGDATTETAGLLQYYANWIDTTAGTPTGVFYAKSSTPGTNPIITSGLREDPIPRGYDLMKSLYGQCRIYASNISVQVINGDSTQNSTIMTGIYTKDLDDQTLTNPTTADEMIGNTIPGFRYKNISSSYATGSKALLKHSFHEKYMSKEDRMQNEFAPAQSNSSKQQIYNIDFVNLFGSVSMNAVVVVKILYKCKWTNPLSFGSDDTP